VCAGAGEHSLARPQHKPSTPTTSVPPASSLLRPQEWGDFPGFWKELATWPHWREVRPLLTVESIQLLSV